MPSLHELRLVFFSPGTTKEWEISKLFYKCRHHAQQVSEGIPQHQAEELQFGRSGPELLVLPGPPGSYRSLYGFLLLASCLVSRDRLKDLTQFF